MFSTVKCNACGDTRTAILENGEDSCIMNCVDRQNSCLETDEMRVKCIFGRVENAEESKKSN